MFDRLLPIAALLAGACTPSGMDSHGEPDDSGAPTDSGEPWWSDPPGDADGDGYSVEEGDCDDGDAQAHPGVGADACDGRDEDCDGAVDEDYTGDEWEPNDTSAGSLGQLDDGDEILIFGTLHPSSDVDRFSLRLSDDDWSWFSLEAWLYQVPQDADYSLEILWVADPSGQDQGSVASADEAGLGGIECADWGGEPGQDDGGTYEIVVRSTQGAACAAPYLLQILVGGV